MVKLCAICGENPATTRDHIPPKSIYPSPIPNDMNLHVVPACLECNGGGSKDDEQFKLLIGIATGEFRENESKVIDLLAKTVGNNRRLAHQIFSTEKRGYARYKGPLLEPAVSVEFDRNSFDRVVERIVRALYWKEFGSSLGLKPKILVLPLIGMEPEHALSFKELMDMLPPKKLNNDTFAYKVGIDDEGNSIWGMQFFKKYTLFALADKP